MKYSVDKLKQKYAENNQIKHTTNDKQKHIDIESNIGANAYTDSEYIVLMKELDNLYSAVDSLSLTEKFISGE